MINNLRSVETARDRASRDEFIRIAAAELCGTQCTRSRVTLDTFIRRNVRRRSANDSYELYISYTPAPHRDSTESSIYAADTRLSRRALRYEEYEHLRRI